MAIQIKLKNSVVQDSTPSTSDLPAVGEIALNANINSIGGFMRASDNSIVKIFGPGSLSTPTATTTVSGISELATNSETTTGTATNRVVTPAGLNAVTVAERSTSNSTYLALAGGTLTGVVAATAGSNSAPSIHFGDSDSGIFGGTNTVSLAAGGTTRLTADTGVSVVGTLAVTGAITSTSDLTIADKIIHAGDTNTAVRFPAADTVSVETGGSEAIRVDSSQRLFVGVTSGTVGGFSPKLFVERADSSASIGIFRSAASNFGPFILLGKSRASSLGGSTIVQDDDRLGQIAFYGADGTDRNTQAAEIKAEVDGTPGANDMPGRLVFSTTADGDETPTARMTIKADGKIGLGTASPVQLLHIESSSAPTLRIDDSDTSGALLLQQDGANGSALLSSAGTFSIGVSNDNSAATLTFLTRNNERMRIASDGKIGVGTTSPVGKLDIRGTGTDFQGLRIVNTQHDTNAASSAQIKLAITNSVGERSIRLQCTELGTNSNDLAMDFYTGGSNSNDSETLKMRIDNLGNVGIGTASPSVPSGTALEIYGSSASRLKLSNSTTGTGSTDGFQIYMSGSSAILENKENAEMRFYTNASERLRIDSSGNVGIGTTSPAYNLDISNSSGEGQLRIDSSAGNHGMIRFSQGGTNKSYIQHVNGNHLAFGPNGSEKMRIDSSGNVGIGTTSPARKFVVTEATANRIANFTTGGTAGAFIAFLDSNTTDDSKCRIGTIGGNLLGLRGDSHHFQDGDGNERMRIDSSGNVGIGTSSPAKLLDVKLESNGTVEQYLRNTVINLLSKINGTTSGQFGTETSHPLAFLVANNERMRIDTSGRLLLGTSTARSVGGESNPRLHIEGTGATSNSWINLTRFAASNGSPNIQFAKSRSDTAGTYTVVQDGDNLGQLSFLGADGTDMANYAAIIKAQVDGTPGSNDMPGRLLFMTTADGGTFPTERMRIDSAGRLFVGTTSTTLGNSGVFGEINLRGGTEGAAIHMADNDANVRAGFFTTDNTNYFVIRTITNHPMVFRTNNTERMRIKDSGSILIGTSDWTTSSGGLNITTSSNVSQLNFSRPSSFTGSQNVMLNYHNGTYIGGINTTTTATSFPTSSDYRLKENVVAMSDGITRLKTLKPYKFNFKSEPSKTVDGFFAHEVSPVVPNSVFGEKDGEQMQALDHSKLVPLLVAAVQELIGKVEALEAA